jgi:hypothetical protein
MPKPPPPPTSSPPPSLNQLLKALTEFVDSLTELTGLAIEALEEERKKYER